MVHPQVENDRDESRAMRRLTRGYFLRNASLGDFVVVPTSQSVLTQT